MTNKRVDEPTGTEFVGHEWDGIEELDTPMPRWWLWTFYACIVWAIFYVIAYPAWPMLEKGTQGMLGWTSRGQVADELRSVEVSRADLHNEIANTPLAALATDDGLMAQAVAGGSAAFKVNCVQCHGAGAAGSEGFPNLADDDWLWGGDMAAIEATLVHGIRQQGDPATRTSTMPGFAGAIEGERLNALVSHVMSLSGDGAGNEAGAQTYAENCALCHGPAGEGDRRQGAPALNDAIWLYGSGREAVTAQILRPRMGMMPSWGERLDPVTIRMLAAYVHSLGGGEDLAPNDLPDAASEPDDAN